MMRLLMCVLVAIMASGIPGCNKSDDESSVSPGTVSAGMTEEQVIEAWVSRIGSLTKERTA